MRLHVNPAVPHEVSGFAFWVRELYCASLGVLAVLCVARLGRPGTRLGLLPTGIAVVVLITWILAAISLFSAASQSRVHLLLGTTFAVCPFLIAFISAPLFFSFLWPLRRYVLPSQLVWSPRGLPRLQEPCSRVGCRTG
jgi:hypothetical protein